MATYTGKETIVNIPVAEAFNKLSDISAFQSMLDKVPAEERAKLGDVKFTSDEIIIGTPQMGNITLKVVERREPELLQFSALQSPVPLNMNIKTEPIDENTTKAKAEIEIDIPVFLRPLVGNKMQKAADRFSETIGTLLKINA